jgi:hypothetical protein
MATFDCPTDTPSQALLVMRSKTQQMEAVERELKRRERAMTAARRRQSQQSRLALRKVSHGRKRHMPDL